MPTETHHLRQGQMEYLDDYADEHGLDNRSQAIKQILDDYRGDGDE